MAVNVEVESKELDNFLESFESKLKRACQGTLDALADRALEEMQSNYSKAEYQAGEYMDFSKVGSQNEKSASMSGPQAWYSEFGTGTRGELHPHPLKGRFALDGYNSHVPPLGTIRAASERVAQKEDAMAAGITEGTLYWTYKGADGKVHYTQGIPAQKEVYDAGQTVHKEMPEIVEKYMKEVFGK